jgi:hypothetical protein
MDAAQTMLGGELQRLKSHPGTPPAMIAELMGLAGDHAQAAGRDDQAVFLWKQALRRFREAGLGEQPAARALAAKVDLPAAAPPEPGKLH